MFSSIKKHLSNAIATVGALLFVFFIATVGYRSYHFFRYGTATECKIDSIYLDRRYHKVVAFSFKVDTIHFNGTAPYDERIKPLVGGHYTVEYSFKDPTIHRIKYY